MWTLVLARFTPGQSAHRKPATSGSKTLRVAPKVSIGPSLSALTFGGQQDGDDRGMSR